MKFSLIFSIFLLFLFRLDAQNKTTKPTLVRINNVEMQDSQYLKLYNSIQEINSKLKPDEKTFWEKNTAAIVTFIVGLLAVFANIFIHISLKKSNERTHQVQINNSHEIVKKQIQNSQELAIIQYKGELMANNRQEWLNTVRVQISEFIVNSSMFYLSSKSQDESEKKNFFEKIQLNMSQLDLLLNPELELHNDVYLKMHSLASNLTDKDVNADNHSLKSKELIKSSRTLLYNEWKKIQELAVNA